MKKILFLLLVLGIFATLFFPTAARVDAAGPQWVIVNWGDTLYSIAARYGVSVSAMMQANNLPNPNFVYAGQRLIIPTAGYAPAPNSGAAAPVATNGYYTVRAGDTLYLIAARLGTTVSAMAQANGIWNYNFIYTGQMLKIPGSNTSANQSPPVSHQASNAGAPNPAPQPNPQPAPAATAAKWIDVNISKQTITAYEGSTPVKSVLVSTGVAAHPTVVGRYRIYAKYTAYTMSGGTPGVDYYHLPNVPWTMFFYQGYAIHGTYWHHNFGHPMSHGCVNLTIADAKWFYDWASVGTLVVTHY